MSTAACSKYMFLLEALGGDRVPEEVDHMLALRVTFIFTIGL